MFVAGTTDPINTAGLKHQANTDYWRSSKTNFWNKIKDLKPQYLDLHIEGDFFSWSGDNDKRKKLSFRPVIGSVFKSIQILENQEVHIHLIGHSHGGNVINQFTELIATDSKYPKPWKVKSITYLSTPFFKKKHQLNHSKLHKECKIINVHNEYDLTQQLIADFSLVNLEIFLRNFQMSSFRLV
jgi:poly(3-hydroxyalkanoate) synthetase